MDINLPFGIHIGTKGMTTRSSFSPSSVDLSLTEKVDAKLARDIWHNVSMKYKLSASVAICGIKALDDYIGTPIIKMSGPAKQAKKIAAGCSIARKTIHRAIFTEGNKFIWLTYDNNKKDVVPVYFNMDDVYKLYIDIDTKDLKAVSFRQSITYLDKNGNSSETTRTKFFDENQIITEYDGVVPDGKKRRDVFTHNYGFIPVIWATFNKGDDEEQGHGLIEPIEPYLMCMHTIMENRVIEDKRSSRKKYVITGKDPESWLARTKQANGITGDGAVPLENLDVFFATVDGNGREEKVGYLTPGQTASDSIQILKMLFMNVIETLRIPEFVFPPKLGASFASAQIQVPTFTQGINEYQDILSPMWVKIASMYAKILSRAELTSEVEVKEIKWKRVDLESPEIRAKIVNYMMSSMKIAKDEGLMNDREIRAYLDSYMYQLDDIKDFENPENYAKMIEALEKVKEAFGSTTEKTQDGDNLINNENRNKES